MILQKNFLRTRLAIPKDNSFNLLCKRYLYRIFPIHYTLVEALTGKSLIHHYFCVKSISIS